MKNQKYDNLFKLLIIGESGVGKTCLLLRFADDTYTTNHLPTIGIDFKIKVVNQEGKIVKLQIWDTAGQDRFKTITKTYYKGANGVILTYDVTDLHSFKGIQNWMKQIDENASADVKKILIGNKCDKENREVTYEEGLQFANEYKLPFFEASARTNKNVNEIFDHITKELIKYDLEHKREVKNLDAKKLKNEKVSNGGCCK